MNRSCGIIAHPTSFPSRFGIGDLGEYAINFIDFMYESRQTLWQVLPLGPTSFGDSPYQSFSTFAGNNLLISPELLLKEGYLSEDDLLDVPEFDALSIEYGRVIIYKNELFKKAYENFKVNASKEQTTYFEKFCKTESSWLNDYALFFSLKNYFIQIRENTFESDEYKEYAKLNKKYLNKEQIDDYFYGAVWNSWPYDIARREPTAVKYWSDKLDDEIGYVKFLQFEFFRQWERIREYAQAKEIKIIGDIPIFVAMDSSDVWSRPELFKLDKNSYPIQVAGVPPDYFSETGQLWGNPLYEWTEHKKDNYKWWIKRIKACLKLVDIVRIDHFRGFESFYTIKYGSQTAIKGKWEKGPGKEFFDCLNAALGGLPIIAEDLGIITDKVNELRNNVGLPGMKVLQFAFSCDPKNLYLPYNFNSSFTVLYTGTHDNDTALGWYTNTTEQNRDHFRRYMNVSGEDVSWDMIRLAYSSTAEYVLVPIQDVLSLGAEARMNTPGTRDNCWQFRLTEDMINETHAKGLAYLAELYARCEPREESNETVEETELESAQIE